MKKLLFPVLAIYLCTSGASGQSLQGISGFSVDSSRMAFGVYGNYALASTALTNRMYMDFLRGNYLEREALDKASGRLVKFNKAGGDLHYGLFFSQRIDSLFGKSGFSYFVNAADRLHGDVLFTDDLFTVLFYGNKPFEGDTAEMGTFSANYLHYQQVQFGLMKSGSNQSVLGIGFSLLKGQEFYQMNIARANLYTSALGNQNDLDLSYGIVQSDPGAKSMSAMNGWGFALDAFYQIPYYVLQDSVRDDNNWSGYLRVEANDLGFIRWNDSSMTQVKDSVYHNEGIWIPSALTMPPTWADDQADSLDKLLEPETSRGSFAGILPASFHLKMYQENSKGLYLNMGTVLRLFAHYSPMIYLGGGKRFSGKYRLGGNLEFGGYGRFNLGLEAGVQVRGYEIALGSRSLGGLIFPKIAGGNSAMISIIKRL